MRQHDSELNCFCFIAEDTSINKGIVLSFSQQHFNGTLLPLNWLDS